MAIEPKPQLALRKRFNRVKRMRHSAVLFTKILQGREISTLLSKIDFEPSPTPMRTVTRRRLEATSDQLLLQPTKVNGAVQSTPSGAQEVAAAISSAKSKEALAIPELLELVILHMQPSIILTTACNVSQRWKEVVDTSPVIQRELMVRPRSSEVSSPVSFASSLSGLPIFWRSFRTNPALQRLRDESQQPSESPWAVSFIKTSYWMTHTPGQELIKLSRTPTNRLDAVLVAGRWRDLHLAEPRISTANVRVEVMKSSGRVLCQQVGQSCFSIRSRDGIRLGMLEDAVLSALEAIATFGGISCKGFELSVEASVWFFAPEGKNC